MTSRRRILIGAVAATAVFALILIHAAWRSLEITNTLLVPR